MGDLSAVLTEVRSLLDASARDEQPSRAVVEHTLTDGYAYALGLERERLRIERRLRELVGGEAGGGTPAAVAEETVELITLLAAAEQELASVRALLSSLRAQAF